MPHTHPAIQKQAFFLVIKSHSSWAFSVTRCCTYTFSCWSTQTFFSLRYSTEQNQLEARDRKSSTGLPPLICKSRFIHLIRNIKAVNTCSTCTTPLTGEDLWCSTLFFKVSKEWLCLSNPGSGLSYFSINLQVFGGHVGNVSMGNLLYTSWLLCEQVKAVFAWQAKSQMGSQWKQQRLSLIYHLLNLPHWQSDAR